MPVRLFSKLNIKYIVNLNCLKMEIFGISKNAKLTWWSHHRKDCLHANCWCSSLPRTLPGRKRLEVPCQTIPSVLQFSPGTCPESVSHQQAEIDLFLLSSSM